MGGGGGEGGGERARARPHLQLVRVLARHACAGRGGATAWTGRGGPAQRLQQLLGRVRFDPERTLVQHHPGAADTDCWCRTLPSGTGFEAAPVSFLARVVPTTTSCTSSD